MEGLGAGLFRKDFAPLLGFTLSLLEGRLITRCYVGKAFTMKTLLKQNLELLKLRSSRDKTLAAAVEDLEEGLMSLMGYSSQMSSDARIHEYFYNAGVTALNLTPKYSQTDVKKDGLASFDRLLLCYKIQAICGYFQFLENKFGVVRNYPSDEFVNPNLADLVDKLMDTSPVRDASRTLVTKGWTIQRKKKNKKNRKKSSNMNFQVGKKIKAIPGVASYVLLRSLLVDRAIQTYVTGALMASRYSKTLNTKENPSMFQQKLKVKDKEARTAFWSEEANSNLITLAVNEEDENPVEKSKVELISSITFASKGIVPLNGEGKSVYATNKDWFVVGYMSGVVEVYDSQSLNMITTFDNECGVTCLAIDSFNHRLFSGGVDGSIKEWDSSKNWEQKTDLSLLTQNTSAVTCLATDERASLTKRTVKHLISGYANGKVDVWSLLSGTGRTSHLSSVVHDPKGQSVTAIALRSSMLFTGGDDNMLKVWDLFTDRREKECLKRILLNESISSIVVDDDVVFTSSGPYLRSYDRTTFMKVHELELPDTITALSMDKNRCLYTFEQSIRKWNIEALVETMKLEKEEEAMLRRSRTSQYGGNRKKVKKTREARKRLNKILENPKKRNQFMGFLKTVYAEENLTFWIAVQRYREFFSQGIDPNAIGQVGVDIVKKYVENESEHCINISQQLRGSLIQLQPEEFKRDTFAAVEEEVLILIEDNFLNSFTTNARMFSSNYEKGKHAKRKKKDPRLINLQM